MHRAGFITLSLLSLSSVALAEEQALSTPAWLWPSLFGVAVAVVGALLTRSINAMDRSIEKLSEELVETRHSLANNLQNTTLKLAILEARFDGVEKRINDHIALLGKQPEKH